MHWSYDGSYQQTEIYLEGLPEWLEPYVAYAGNENDGSAFYWTATVTFLEPFESLNDAIPVALQSLEWCSAPGGNNYGQFHWKTVNCSATFTPRLSSAPLSQGDTVYRYQEVYVDVEVPEGMKVAVIATTNSSYSAINPNNNTFSISVLEADRRYRLTINANSHNDLYCYIVATFPPQANRSSIDYYKPSPDGSKPVRGNVYDLTDLFQIDTSLPFSFSASLLYNGGPYLSVSGTTIRIASTNNTNGWQNLRVFAYQGWRHNYSSAYSPVYLETYYYFRVNVHNQSNFAGEVVLPGGEAVTGVTIVPEYVNVTQEEQGLLIWQWQRSNDGERWEDIDGATGATYTPTAEDAGMQIRLHYTFGGTIDWNTDAVAYASDVWNVTVTPSAAEVFYGVEGVTVQTAATLNGAAQASGTVRYFLNGEMLQKASLGETIAIPATALSPGANAIYALYQPVDSELWVRSAEVTVTAAPQAVALPAALAGGDCVYCGREAEDPAHFTVRWDAGAPIDADEVALTITRNGLAYAPDDSEIVRGETSVTFTPWRAGEYAFAAGVDSATCTGSAAAAETLTIEIRPLSVEPVDETVYVGQQPALEARVLVDGSSLGLAEGDSIEITPRVTDVQGNAQSDLANLSAGDYSFRIQSVRIVAEDGTDVTRDYAVTAGGMASLCVEDEPDFVVTIPAQVSLDADGEGALTIALDTDATGLQVDVRVHSENEFALVDKAQNLRIGYAVARGDSQSVAQDGIAASFAQEGSAGLSLKADGLGAPGEYSDTLTFTVDVNAQ